MFPSCQVVPMRTTASMPFILPLSCCLKGSMPIFMCRVLSVSRLSCFVTVCLIFRLLSFILALACCEVIAISYAEHLCFVTLFPCSYRAQLSSIYLWVGPYSIFTLLQALSLLLFNCNVGMGGMFAVIRTRCHTVTMMWPGHARAMLSGLFVCYE